MIIRMNLNEPKYENAAFKLLDDNGKRVDVFEQYTELQYTVYNIQKRRASSCRAPTEEVF